jgi:hypothetical protein
MFPAEEFLRHAAECERMARQARDPALKAAWRGMADRWVRCAELAELQVTAAQEASAARRRHKERRQPGWAPHRATRASAA